MVVQIYNTYRPSMHPNDSRVAPNFIVQALRGDLYSDGNQTHVFCYVDDLIEGSIRLMSTTDEITGPINIGNPHEIPIRELDLCVIRLTGSKSSLAYRPLPQDDPVQRCPDISLVKHLFGWEPHLLLDNVLLSTVGYFQTILPKT